MDNDYCNCWWQHETGQIPDHHFVYVIFLVYIYYFVLSQFIIFVGYAIYISLLS